MPRRPQLPVLSSEPTDARDQIVCQTTTMASAATSLNRIDRTALLTRKYLQRFSLRLRKVASDPSLILRKFRRSRAGMETGDSGQPSIPTAALASGDRVRVRSTAEILATLDAAGRCEGMTYLPTVMDRFIGGTFTVRRPVDYFFDERRWKMLRLRNTVILEGVYCEPPIWSGVAWAGCSRSCFLFWKEAWLERVSADA